MKARFLNERDKRLAIQRTLGNKTGVMDEDQFRMDQMWKAFRDPQSWSVSLYTFSINICNGKITTVSRVGILAGGTIVILIHFQFNCLLIDVFGFSPLRALLLHMPVRGCQLIVLAAGVILATIIPSAQILVMACICAISLAGMLLIYCLSQVHPYGRLAGTYLAAIFAANIPLSLSLVGLNVGGFTKISTVNGMLLLADSAENIVGPQFYLSSQEPRYPVS